MNFGKYLVEERAMLTLDKISPVIYQRTRKIDFLSLHLHLNKNWDPVTCRFWVPHPTEVLRSWVDEKQDPKWISPKCYLQKWSWVKQGRESFRTCKIQWFQHSWRQYHDLRRKITGAHQKVPQQRTRQPRWYREEQKGKSWEKKIPENTAGPKKGERNNFGWVKEGRFF